MPALLEDLIRYATPEGLRRQLERYPELRMALNQRLDAFDSLMGWWGVDRFGELLGPVSMGMQAEDLARTDPVAALELALRAPSDSPRRLRALAAAAVALFQSDPEEARRWVEHAPVSAEEYRLLTGKPRS